MLITEGLQFVPISACMLKLWKKLWENLKDHKYVRGFVVRHTTSYPNWVLCHESASNHSLQKNFPRTCSDEEAVLPSLDLAWSRNAKFWCARATFWWTSPTWSRHLDMKPSWLLATIPLVTGSHLKAWCAAGSRNRSMTQSWAGIAHLERVWKPKTTNCLFYPLRLQKNWRIGR